MTSTSHVDATLDVLWMVPVTPHPPVGNHGRLAGLSLAPSHPCGILWIPVGQPHPA
jgi:hypothetical protein